MYICTHIHYIYTYRMTTIEWNDCSRMTTLHIQSQEVASLHCVALQWCKQERWDRKTSGEPQLCWQLINFITRPGCFPAPLGHLNCQKRQKTKLVTCLWGTVGGDTSKLQWQSDVKARPKFMSLMSCRGSLTSLPALIVSAKASLTQHHSFGLSRTDNHHADIGLGEIIFHLFHLMKPHETDYLSCPQVTS